ncbi:MAG: TetR/AcrR family transcriptional regulator [Candidatus Nanopelagicales bacterium]
MHGEHNRATRELLEAARAELRDVGQAAFTMDAVARRAYYSPGAIYQRWPDRVSLLGDVGREVLADLEGALAGVGDAEASISFALDDGRDLLGLVSEILIAGHTSTDIRDVSLAMWSALRTAMGRHLPPGMAWYLSIVGLGDAMLASIDIAAPLPVGPRIRWMLDACDVEAMGLHVPRPGALTQADVPAVPQPARSDPTTLALIQAAQSLLAEQGAESLSTRRVSAQAGVTTGAIYRRYDGKGALLADVLLVALAPDRYEWTWELVAALASDDPYWAAADVMTAQLLAASRNEAEQRVLLQIGVAARTDTALRAQIQERVRVASEARCAMFDHLGKAGVIRADIDPAVLAWGFQSEPVGLRAIIPLGIPVDEEAATLSMRAVLTAAAAR